MKVVVLCAGLGSRLNSKQPKGFIKVKNRTLLERCIENFLLKKIKKKDIYFATGYKQKLIKRYVCDFHDFATICFYYFFCVEKMYLKNK